MRPYRVVDVFAATPLRGNPLAVIFDAEGLSDEEMQSIAAWTNLSETTFCLPPTKEGADYRVRIFTPRDELPFAGHPTLGTAHALMEAGLITPGDGAVTQECAVGLVRVEVGEEAGARTRAFDLPTPTIRDLSDDETKRLIGILGQPVAKGTVPALVDVGARWVVAELESAEVVIDLCPDYIASAVFENDLKVSGVTIFGPHTTGDTGIEVRSFAPSSGIEEDPVCGSGNGSVAAYRLHAGRMAAGHDYRAAQGRCVGRAGQIYVKTTEAARIQVGGAAVTTVTGTIAL